MNNALLHERICGFLAKYQEEYNVNIYAFVMQGNHYHLIASFPDCNKSNFMQSLNSMIAKLVAEYVPNFKEGKLWARRFSEQVLPRNEDIFHWFYYCALNPVLSGLSPHPKKYDGYNSFFDASVGRQRSYQVFNKSDYNEAIRRGRDVTSEEFTTTHFLKYERLPGYDHLCDADYSQYLCSELEKRCLEASKDKIYPSISKMRAIVPGSLPKNTKKSTRHSFRPLVLTLCTESKQNFLNFYFSLRDKFITASKAYRSGVRETIFPWGTYPPRICFKF